MTIMSKFHELNNYIVDVPMRFSDKYISLQVNSNTLLENVDGEDFIRFKTEDYNFGAELIAIEMFELHQKKKLEVANKSTSNNSSDSIVSSNKLPNDDSANSYITTHSTPHSSSRANQSNNFFYNMVPGEILKPQLLNNNNSSNNNSSVSDSKPPVHSECDKPSSSTSSYSDNKLASKLRKNLVNPWEFENDDSSPFDNVELQTIDEIKELNNVFQALNTSPEARAGEGKKENGHLNSVSNNIDTNRSNSTKVATQGLNMYQPNVPMSNYSSSSPHRENSLTNHVNMKQASTSPYSHARQSGLYNHHQHSSQVGSTGSHQYNNSTFNSIPVYNHTQCYNIQTHLNYDYQQPCNSPSSQAEMKRSSSEKRDLFNANYDTAAVDQSTNALRSTKSVSDLTNISNIECNYFDAASRTSLHDRSQTPPVQCPATSKIEAKHSNQSKPISLSDPYQSLSESEKHFVDNLCQMGFKRDRVSRAVKHIDIGDDKKIFEYLFALQLLEDQGYDCYESEIALHMNNYNKDHAEAFLKALKQICDFGFDKEAAIKALFKSNNDRDRAIDLLLNRG